ncbi:RagB/SusD family nutrient uptake outer membrane protein [Seonamhaeicola maritimus]|uniref:RagB/SusD family nutrient uptake outer membrane protein n=1 Tax=Seonamhaeicola maritimus TaxID=2591822 RepID=A0A5C7GMH5_9FLAO|nr:RagB/SusD family nutrient uptake outer membrane protein [Seonamhaeicola maritimus]TXG39488.1 RagB/SusD family nutrient uptake outer membrane protein [Seonamhaeicola maritimus]
MKNFKIKLIIILGLILSFSCEDYLDQAPESTLDQEEVFSTFKNAQGFVEEMYASVVDYGTSAHTFQDYIYGDDAYGNRTWKASYQIDFGNLNAVARHRYSYLWNWQSAEYGTNNANINQANASRRPGLWDGSLRGIRKANIVIASVEQDGLMVDATQEERDVILGQAYFFRAFFHNEIMKFYGRFPYIKEVLVGDFAIPRPETYKECALEANEDYKRAIELLPLNWDDEAYGQLTFGENKGRLTKGVAYAFQGKNLLLAGSPLMHGNNKSINTYEYDTELCNMAVDAFAGILKLDDQGFYDLATWENYDEVFWKTPTPNSWPGSTEFVFSAPGGNQAQAQRFMTAGIDRDIHGRNGSEIVSPTHNFIHQNFGMSNGLSIEDDLSGLYGPTLYDPLNPFDNRDPRFYKWVVIDGEVFGTKASIPAKHRVAQLFTGGEHRSTGSDNQPSTTGYMHKKFYPIIDGEFHSKWNRIIDQYTGVRLHMRLTDVYLMYAEALHAAKGATTAPASYPLTAEAAINLFRSRAGIPDVHPSIVSNSNKFMDELRRERSVELSYEAHRWVDIRRWGVAHEIEYRRKTSFEFPQDHSSYTENLLVERVCEFPKHYWLPFEAKQTQIYEGFPQNPGW